MLDLSTFGALWLPKLEAYLRGMLAGEAPVVSGMYGMMRYHLGWEDPAGQPETANQGKRVRPLVVLLACQAAGGDPYTALPAAAAVELVHNFSLIHDDIEDGSPTRRHRPTLWSLFGPAQAINAGDAMFTLARLALARLSERETPAPRALSAFYLFDQTCLCLTEGQHLDMSFETRTEVSPDDYLTMIGGKTAALLAASAQLGAIVAGASQEAGGQFWRFGHELGLSFQIQDDILGIWGDEAQTGKSAASDLLTRKKTLPVLFALARPGDDAQALRRFYRPDHDLTPGDLTPSDLPAMLALLDRLGARSYAAAAAQTHAEAALAALAATGGEAEGVAMLRELALKLLGRES
ncbi:MAG: polyprenyl synthetase family protein [Caldilineales bacterium]|nr:polyprenyl synthetase family protein [Caldilineales bacterium]MCW5856897.1 polyprenyl synthetase family protein [Caldilineales bacterium]